MSLISNSIAGFKQGFKFRRVAGYIFLIQLFLGLLIGFLGINYVNSSIGSSTNLMKIIGGYNHDVFQDLLRFESTGWSMIKTFIWLVLLIYFFIGPFIMGGLLSSYHSGIDQWNIFWRGGSQWYFPFLKLNLLIFLCLIMVLAILGVIGFFFTSYSLENMLTEIPALIVIFGLIFLFILYIIHIVTISTKTKWAMIANADTSVWRLFRTSAKEVRGRFAYFIVLGLLFLILTLIFGLLANSLINYVPESSFILILLAFLMQLLVLLFRVFLRNAYYATMLAEN